MAPVDAVFRPEFRDALGLLAKVIGNMCRRGLMPPILVGGAAVEFYTGGAVTTGDFDFVTPLQDEFFEELERVGFRGQTAIDRRACAFTRAAASASKS